MSMNLSEAEANLTEAIEKMDNENICIDVFDRAYEEVDTTSSFLLNKISKVLGDKLDYVNEFIDNTQSKLNDNLLSDEDLELLLMRLPIQLYYLSTTLAKLELEVSTAEVNHKVTYSSCYLDSSDITSDSKSKKTVATKESEATINSKESRLTYYVFKSALVELKSKMSACEELLDSARSIKYQRVEEMKLANRGIGSEIE